jgi:hypothetical protein
MPANSKIRSAPGFQPDCAWETGFAESDPKPLAPAPNVLANLNGQIPVLFNFSDKPTNQALEAGLGNNLRRMASIFI